MKTNIDKHLPKQDQEKKAQDRQAVQQASRLTAPQIYEVVRRDGVEELRRPLRSLIWSGLAAGILISFSVMGEALLRNHLPDTEWRPLVENLGYSFGFLLVILGRMQLFTENTITTVLPLYAAKGDFNHILRKVARLWFVVVTANMLGAWIAAGFITVMGNTSPDMVQTILQISTHSTSMPVFETFLRAIPAGILIAAIVWMLPSAGGNAFWIVLIFTYLIALADLAHVIAGSVEVALVVLAGKADFLSRVFTFGIPALVGNVVGGTAVFTLMAWGQVREEV